MILERNNLCGKSFQLKHSESSRGRHLGVVDSAAVGNALVHRSLSVLGGRRRSKAVGCGGWGFRPVRNILRKVLASILDLGAAAKLAGVVNRGRVESPCCEWESGYMGLVMGGEFEVEDLCKPWLSPCFPGVFYL